VAREKAGVLEQEVAQLRDEVRRLREEQNREHEKLTDGNGPAAEKTEKDAKAGGDEGRSETDREREKQKKGLSTRAKVLILAAIAVILFVGLSWWLYSRQFESTDDAQVDGHISGLAARTSGTVTGVYVEEDPRRENRTRTGTGTIGGGAGSGGSRAAECSGYGGHESDQYFYNRRRSG